MPGLDDLATALYEGRGDALLVESGKAPVLVTGANRRPLASADAPTAEALIDMIAEAAPGDALEEMMKSSRANFSYDAPAGSVTVEVLHDAETVRMRIVPTGAKPKRETPAETPEKPKAAPSPVAAAVPPPRASKPAPRRGAAPAAPAPVPVRARDGAPAIEAYFQTLVQERCSDLHLSSDCAPMYRKDGEMVLIGDTSPLSAARVDALVRGILPVRNQEEFETIHDTDFAYEIPGVARIRCNAFVDCNGTGGVFRTIPATIVSAEELGLPPAILEMCELDKGLVVVTGPTGSGKSTTLAAMIDYINRRQKAHIITIEDPIEFVHPNRLCLVNQREVGPHTNGFKSALRAALREDPDIVLVGEMRDLETVAIAIETAETGHLVFGTLHTNTAASTVDRIIDQFSADRQQQIRTMLAESLKGVVSQTLLKKKGGGRVAAYEILPVTPSVSNLIREAKTFQITSVMQAGKGMGMLTMSDAIVELVKKKLVTPEEALEKAPSKAEIKSGLAKLGILL